MSPESPKINSDFKRVQALVTNNQNFLKRDLEDTKFVNPLTLSNIK